MFGHIRLANKCFQQILKKTKKLPPQTPKKQKSKKECSSELMMKTKKCSDTLD